MGSAWGGSGRLTPLGTDMARRVQRRLDESGWVFYVRGGAGGAGGGNGFHTSGKSSAIRLAG
jgi:hypothetical protein